MIAELQAEQPQYYAGLVQHLSMEEQSVISAVLQQADTQEAAAQQAAAAANGTS